MSFGPTRLRVNSSEHTDGVWTVRDVTLSNARPKAPRGGATAGVEMHCRKADRSNGCTTSLAHRCVCVCGDSRSIHVL